MSHKTPVMISTETRSKSAVTANLQLQQKLVFVFCFVGFQIMVCPFGSFISMENAANDVDNLGQIVALDFPFLPESFLQSCRL